MSEYLRLKDRIEELESLLGIDDTRIALIARVFSLTEAEAKLIGFIAKRPLATHEAIYAAMYGDRPDADWPESNVIKVLIHHLRRKLPQAIQIKALINIGYRMSDAHRALFERLLREATDDRPAPA